MTDANKVELDDLARITGGVGSTAHKEQLMRIACPYCQEIFQADVTKHSVKCPTCHKTIEIKG